MHKFFLKRFEVGGLNCVLSNVPIGTGPKNRLSNVLEGLSESGLPLRFETSKNVPADDLPCLKRIMWTKTFESSLFRTGEEHYMLESRREGLTVNEFRYTISDQLGQTVISKVDSDQPIFSEKSPYVETGFSVRIDLISIAKPRIGGVPILARIANRNFDWIYDRDLVLEL